MKKEVYWYLNTKPETTKVEHDLSAEVVVVGGGVAGLACAQRLVMDGKKVILIEAGFCGAGASGKTSGFITPDSELELSHLIENYGKEEAKKIWSFVVSGVDLIRKNIEANAISCDYQVQDSFFIANSKKAFSKVKSEHEARVSLGYDSTLYPEGKVREVIDSEKYYGAVRYPDTFGMNSYLYCQAMKEVLIKMGVQIYEESKVDEIGNGFVKVNEHVAKAENVVIATDRFLPDLGYIKKDVYHVQTFLSITRPLSDDEVKQIFKKDHVMVWDTDIIYQYYRLVEGNRLLLGAADLLYTYLPKEHQPPAKVLKKIRKYMMTKFPHISFDIEYTWSGMLGVSKDFLPIAGPDKNMSNVYFIAGASGLPWAAALGNYIGEKISKNRSDYDVEFSPYRKYTFGGTIQTILTTPVTFALSHGIVKYLK